jgi:deoxyadenosine/deoxycytidine kinase
MTTIVMLEGNIGSGKTTFSRGLSRATVRTEEVGAALLRLFYADPPRYGFALQLAQCLSRQRTLQSVLSEPAMTTTCLDRSVVGDFCFAAWNRALGNLSDDEWAAYAEYAGGTDVCDVLARSLAGYEDVRTTILYLRDAPDACRARALGRGDAERDVDPSYFRGLHAAHDLAFARLARGLPDACERVGLSREAVKLGWLPWTTYATAPPDQTLGKVLAPVGSNVQRIILDGFTPQTDAERKLEALFR